MSELIVIYDGQCDLCKRSITWVKKGLPIDAISYQDGDLASFGLTTTQSYRFVLLPMALRIVIPPLTSESMNIIKNSSVAFAVSVAELTLFAMQAQEETSRGIEIYLGVTALYVVSALSVNRVMAFIESRTRVPGFIAATSSGGH